MSEQNSNEIDFQDPRTRDIFAGIFISVLLVFSLESVIFNWLPWFISGLRYLIIGFFIIMPSISSYRLTNIREFLLPIFAFFAVFIQLPSLYQDNITISMPAENFNNGLINIFGLVLLLVLMLPWYWWVYRSISSIMFRWFMLLSTSLMYLMPIILLFDYDMARSSYTYLILFLCLWVIVASIQVRPLYRSRRVKRAQILIPGKFLLLGLSISLLYLLPSHSTLFIAHLARDIFLYLSWFTMFTNSEALILSKGQTMAAVTNYFEVKSQETGECIVVTNLDTYIRNMPEEKVLSIDNDALTLTWIGLQRTNG